MLYKELTGNPRALWDYLCGLIDNEGRKVASVPGSAPDRRRDRGSAAPG